MNKKNLLKKFGRKSLLYSSFLLYNNQSIFKKELLNIASNVLGKNIYYFTANKKFDLRFIIAVKNLFPLELYFYDKMFWIRSANKDYNKEKCKAWRESHKDYYKAWYQTHKEERRT